MCHLLQESLDCFVLADTYMNFFGLGINPEVVNSQSIWICFEGFVSVLCGFAVVMNVPCPVKIKILLP